MPRSDPESESDPRQWLSGVALDLYEHLEATGQVGRLKQIPQLGAVAWVHPEIKHTRWDYVELLLRLSTCVDRMPDLFAGMGEGGLEIEGHGVGSPCELLQCWAMLQNIGHIWGTFATERLVLNALSVPGGARDLFMEGMTTEADRAFGEYVLGNYLLFKVNWALANGFLHALPERYDAVRFQDESGEGHTALVLGLPGEDIELVENVLIVNGFPCFDGAPSAFASMGDWPLTSADNFSILVANLRMGKVDQVREVPLMNVRGKVGDLW